MVTDRSSKRKSKSRGSKIKKKPAKGRKSSSAKGPNFMASNKEAWIKGSVQNVWEMAAVVDQNAGLLTVRSSGGQISQVKEEQAFPVNSSVEGDITSLHHIHEAGILHNLQERSLKDEPYTLMGPVLVAVNPLRRIADPKGILGKRSAATAPHPYGTAEVAFQQLQFAFTQAEKDKIAAGGDDKKKKGKGKASDESPINQSIVVGGESGAGKTESSKMVLKHLVARCPGSSSSKLDEQLLSTNPILEAFGNATTLRNHNSSRFGRFMKLHLKQNKGKAKMVGASIETYLLERSRVTSHGSGERGYHVFYQLVTAGSKDLKSKLGLTKVSDFSYLTASGGASNKADPNRLKMDDKTDFKAVVDALVSIGLSSEERDALFGVVAGVLHLGNMTFVDEERAEGDAAVVKDKNNGHSMAAKLFGLDKKKLAKLFCEREVKSVGETIIALRNAEGATSSRDAVAKSVYTLLFDWLIFRINKSLAGVEKGGVAKLPFVGVLDIFGFESFEHNSFEQLLINFCNEALQATFNKQVFEAEADLYKREGLVIESAEKMPEPPNNSACMELLQGVSATKKAGVLLTIDVEGRNPQPSDDKLINNLHRTFGTHNNFVKPHPRDRATKFTINHYAGIVQYTVGEFLAKNSDRLPNEVTDVFSKSTVPIIKELWEIHAGKTGGAKPKANGPAARKTNDSIVKKFDGQISDLIKTLDATRCSFIRCVKPNWQMVRKGKDTDWFNRMYITNQLKCLSIPQTAAVLQTGLPTRILYSSLTDAYKKVLPKAALKSFKTLGGGDDRAFVSALFWAFEIPRHDYKLGLTRVFFRSGMLSKLENVLHTEGMEKKQIAKISKRFSLFYARIRWRSALVKVIACNHFLKLQQKAKARSNAVVTIQSTLRRKAAQDYFKRYKNGVLTAQAHYRGVAGRKAAKALQQKLIQERKKEEKRLKAEKEKKAKLAKAAAEAAVQKAEAAKKASAAEKEKLEKEAAKALKAQKKAEKEAAKAAKAEKDAQSLREEAELAAKESERKELEANTLARHKTEAVMQQSKDKAFEKAAEDAKRKERRLSGVGSTAADQRKALNRRHTHKSQSKLQRQASQKGTGNVMDRSLWRQPKFGWGVKQARGRRQSFFSKSNWKKRFFMLDKEQKLLGYYDKTNETGNRGEGIPKGKVFLSMARVGLERGEIDGRKNVVKITAAGEKPINIAFDTTAEAADWVDEIKKAIAGFNTESSTPTFADEQDDATMRMMQEGLAGANDFLIQRLHHIEFMLAEGRITEEDHAELTAKAFREVDEMNQKDEAQAVAMQEAAPMESELISCKECHTVNETGKTGYNCGVCGTALTGLYDDDDDDYVDNRPPLAKFGYNDGTVKIWLGDAKDVLDRNGMAKFTFGMELNFSKSGQDDLGWKVNATYATYRMLHEQLLHNDVKGLPVFPAEKRTLGTSKRQNAKKESFLKKWLAVLFKPENIEGALKTDGFITLVELYRNTVSFDEYEKLVSNEGALSDKELDKLDEGCRILQERMVSNDKTMLDPNVLKVKSLLELSLPRLDVGMNMDDATEAARLQRVLDLEETMRFVLDSYERKIERIAPSA